MNAKAMKKIFAKISEYNKIIISRHIRPDGDCIGAALGLKWILKESFPAKEVKAISDEIHENPLFPEEEDKQESEEYYKDALVIVVDTSDVKRIGNSKYNLGKEIIKIDHHPEKDAFGAVNWTEENKSSVCEMIVDFFRMFSDHLKMNRKAASFLYTGIVTDSGRFRYGSTDGETLRAAAFLLDEKIETEEIYNRIYLRKMSYYRLKGYLYGRIKLTRSGVAYLVITRRMQRKNKLSAEEAGSLISALDSIKGSDVWAVFIANRDGTFRARLRSRGPEVNKTAEKYGGGGHAMASGATAKNKKEMKRIVKDMDDLLREYKERGKSDEDSRNE